jgi:hypothetical protein
VSRCTRTRLTTHRATPPHVRARSACTQTRLARTQANPDRVQFALAKVPAGLPRTLAAARWLSLSLGRSGSGQSRLGITTFSHLPNAAGMVPITVGRVVNTVGKVPIGSGWPVNDLGRGGRPLIRTYPELRSRPAGSCDAQSQQGVGDALVAS